MINQLAYLHWGSINKIVQVGGFGRGKVKMLAGRQFSCQEYDTIEPERRIPIFIIIDRQQLEALDYE